MTHSQIIQFAHSTPSNATGSVQRQSRERFGERENLSARVHPKTREFPLQDGSKSLVVETHSHGQNEAQQHADGNKPKVTSFGHMSQVRC